MNRLGGVFIAGRVQGCTDDGIRRAVYSTVSFKWKFRLWLDHLLCSAVADRAAGDARLVGRGPREKLFAIPPVARDDARAHLRRLLELVLLARRMPLPFFCDSAEALSRLAKHADLNSASGVEHARAVARSEYERRFVGTPAANLPSVQAAFAGLDPFAIDCAEAPGLEDGAGTPLFLRLVQIICEPMFDTMAEAESSRA